MTNKQSHENGILSEEEKKWLIRRAKGDFGIITTAATNVTENGRGWVGEMGVWGDHQIPELNNPLCDALIFSFNTDEQAKEFVKIINDKGLGTKNVPDAIEWHFARYWDHIFTHFGISKEKLWELTEPSAKLLNKSVAIPIMVKMTREELVKKGNIIKEAILEVI